MTNLWSHFRKYLIVFLGIILIASILLANYTGDLRIWYRWTLSDVPIYGATKDQGKIIKEALEILPSAVRNSIVSIDVTEHLPFKANDAQRKEYKTDTDSYHIDGRMFLKPERFNSSDVKADIFHEAGHIFHYSLPMWFEKAWGVLIGPDDDKKIYKGQRIFPRNGFLSERGLAMLKEDIAEYSEESFSYLDNPSQYRGPLTLVNHPLLGSYDVRYKLKLYLMYNVGFFSKEQDDKLIAIVDRAK